MLPFPAPCPQYQHSPPLFHSLKQPLLLSSNPVLQHASCSRTSSNNPDIKDITDQKPALSVVCAVKAGSLGCCPTPWESPAEWFARLSERWWLQPLSGMFSPPRAGAPTQPSAARLWKHKGKRDTQKVGDVQSSPGEGSAVPSMSAFDLTSTRAEHCLQNQQAMPGHWAATCKAREHRAVDVLHSVLLPITTITN